MIRRRYGAAQLGEPLGIEAFGSQGENIARFGKEKPVHHHLADFIRFFLQPRIHKPGGRRQKKSQENQRCCPGQHPNRGSFTVMVQEIKGEGGDSCREQMEDQIRAVSQPEHQQGACGQQDGAETARSRTGTQECQEHHQHGQRPGR